jgi:predicted anti-sigma-YlaC factor YlaD
MTLERSLGGRAVPAEVAPATAGNFSRCAGDIRHVTCATWREALSARLDGEASEAWSDHVDGAALDAHLEACEACRRWYADAALVTRLARFAGAADGAGPGVADTVLDATPRPTRARIARVLRGALAAIGAGQLLIALAQLAGPMATSSTTVMHMTHEFVAWNAALGASFLFIAWRRTRPAALLPLLTAFVGLLTVLSIDDFVHGTVTAARLASHVLLVVGYVVVVAMSRPAFTFDGPPGTRQRSVASSWRLVWHDDATAPSRDNRRARSDDDADAPDSPAAAAKRREGRRRAA